MCGQVEESFRLLKARQFMPWNFSVCQKCVLTACGIFPFNEIACGRQTEWFRYLKTCQFGTRNFFILGQCVGRRVKVLAWAESLFGGARQAGFLKRQVLQLQKITHSGIHCRIDLI